MIGKVKIGSSFGGVVRYVTQKPEAEIIYAEGVRTQSAQTAIEDFNTQRKMNPELNRAVGHIALSWSEKDSDKLSAEIMTERAKEYMQKMKITETQYLIVLHKDKNHPHVHLIYNRVNNQGKTISDRFQKERNHKVCKEITLKYGYHLGNGKSLVNRQQLKGADKIKYELHDAIKLASQNVTSWQELEATLKSQGIEMQFKYKSGSTQIQGVSFSKGELKFKGSEIDRNLSYKNLGDIIKLNQRQQKSWQQTAETTMSETEFQDKPKIMETDSHEHSSSDTMMEDLFNPVRPTYEHDPYLKKKKKRNQYLGHSL
jgi:hypothetical protein